MQTILITGLPGSGKTTLARELAHHFIIPHYNGDVFREKCNDWDFTREGRIRQAYRFSHYDLGIFDFVCPYNEMRKFLNCDFVIWLDTVKQSEYHDTNLEFETPDHYDIRITNRFCLGSLRDNMAKYQTGVQGVTEYLTSGELNRYTN